MRWFIGCVIRQFMYMFRRALRRLRYRLRWWI